MSDRDRPDTSGHDWYLTRNDWTLGVLHPVRITYDDVGDAEKVEKDRTLMLRPIVTGWYLTRNDRTLGLLRPITLSSCVRSSLDC